MKSIHLNVILFLGSLFCYFHAVANDLTTGSIVIQGVPTATKGFPYILRIVVRGPGIMSEESLYDDHVPIRVALNPIAGGRSVILSSAKEPERIYTKPGGGSFEGPLLKRNTRVERGEQASIVVDLASIIPELDKGTLFGDLAPGEYNVSVTLTGMDTQSNTLRLNVVAPTELEKQYLSGFLAELAKIGSFKLGDGIRWSEVLRHGIRFPSNKWSSLSSWTKAQTSFHLLLANVLDREHASVSDDVETIRAASLPEYVEPERQLLLFEINKEINSADNQEIESLVKQYPEMERRLKYVKKGGKAFFLYKSIRDQRAK